MNRLPAIYILRSGFSFVVYVLLSITCIQLINKFNVQIVDISIRLLNFITYVFNLNVHQYMAGTF